MVHVFKNLLGIKPFKRINSFMRCVCDYTGDEILNKRVHKVVKFKSSFLENDLNQSFDIFFHMID